ncbi:MAG: NAD(P)-dependent oxidoreductase [Desulfobacteraceae bacterium]|nr:NAD(P)-dependent oxidoreductase [Desulfobacteraceae bacterium]
MPTQPPFNHNPQKRLLLFGAGGKLGTALRKAFGPDHQLFFKDSRTLDVRDTVQVRRYVEEIAPDLVINAAAYVGIDACEQHPETALAINTLFPKELARLSNQMGFVLAQISTDAVFDSCKEDYYDEADCPRPVNVYGLSKYGADCLVAAIAQRCYIFRIPLLFGPNPRNNQFVEKMLARIRDGAAELRISSDIITSPSYSYDIAQAIRTITETGTAFGTYHIANQGTASLLDLMNQLIKNLKLDVKITGCPHTAFPSLGIKNTYTPLRSGKLESLRPWQEALESYCREIKHEVMA